MSNCCVLTNICCAIAICVCNGLFGTNPLASKHNSFHSFSELASFPKSECLDCRLTDIVDNMSYDNILSIVPEYFDNNTHEFNNTWQFGLMCIQNEYLFSLIINDNRIGKEKAIAMFYAWCEVTAEVICNYDQYSLSNEYKQTIGKILKNVISNLQKKSKLFDDFIEILIDPSSICNFDLPV